MQKAARNVSGRRHGDHYSVGAEPQERQSARKSILRSWPEHDPQHQRNQAVSTITGII